MSSSSSAAAPSAPQQRRKALACLACRTAKSACEGTPPSELAQYKPGDEVELVALQACHRCTRLALQCVWAPTKRVGRPPRSATAAAVAKGTTSKRQRVEQEEEEQESPHASAALATTAWPSAFESAVAAQHNIWSSSSVLFDTSGESSTATAAAWPTIDESPNSSALSPFQDFAPPSSSGAAASIHSGVKADLVDTSGSSSFEPMSAKQLEAWMNEAMQGSSDGAVPTSLQPPPPAPASTDVLSPQALHQLTSLSDSMRSIRTSKPSFALAGASANRFESSSNSAMTEPDVALEIQHGMHEFFRRAAQWIPLLGCGSRARRWNVAADVVRCSEAELLVVQTASALGGRLAGRGHAAAAERALQAARRHAANLIASPPVPPTRACDAQCAGEALAAVQGLCLLATLEAGLGVHAAALTCVTAAARLAKSWGLHRLDAPSGLDSDASLALACARSRWSADGMALLREGTGQEEVQSVLEDLRRAWWELYLIDSQLWVVTSGAAPRQVSSIASRAAVNMPLDPGEESITSSPSYEAYNARVRACALMLEALTPPSAAVASNAARLQALDTMADNLLLSADARWRRSRSEAVAAATEMQQNPSHANEASGSASRVFERYAAAEMKAESALLAMVILHAGRIHLHRKASFPELTLDFESCSFRPGASVTSPGAAEAGEVESDPRRLADSLQKISGASTAILELVKADYRDRTARDASLEATPPMLRHTPFFACSQMVAAYGHVVHLAATRHQAQSVAAPQQQQQLTSSSGAAADAQTLAWQRRVALSDLTLSEANTAECANVWPVAAPYVLQIRRCRAAVDFAGPLGLG